MLVEIITTGSELLLGEIVNEDARYLSQKLNEMGYSVVYHTTVGDNETRMRQALEIALKRVDIVITTGGLGPTQGDMTKSSGRLSWGFLSNIIKTLKHPLARGCKNIIGESR